MGDGSSSSFNNSHIPDLNQGVLTKEHLATNFMSTEWTNEKHSLYLKSMEASFVKDLYGSFNMFGYQIKHPSDPRLPTQKHIASGTSSRQFKVPQRGCWLKINFKRNRPQSVKADGRAFLSENPWIRHYRSSRARVIVTSSTHQEKIASTPDFSSYGSVLEVTDQNFVEEEDMGKNANQKKIKIETSMAPIRIHDQVVPLSKFPGPMDVADKLSLQECECNHVRVPT